MSVQNMLFEYMLLLDHTYNMARLDTEPKLVSSGLQEYRHQPLLRVDG